MQDKRGIKRRCPKCGAFFYDMAKKKFKCPKCGKEYDESAYQSEKEKNLDKILKKEASHLNTDDVDTEVLLQMTNTLTDESDNKIKDDMMDMEEPDTDDLGELNDYLDDYSGNEKDFDG